MAEVMFPQKSEFPHESFLWIRGCSLNSVSGRQSWCRHHFSDLGQIWILAAVAPEIEESKIFVTVPHWQENFLRTSPEAGLWKVSWGLPGPAVSQAASPAGPWEASRAVSGMGLGATAAPVFKPLSYVNKIHKILWVRRVLSPRKPQ